jgi:L-asparaginase II
MSATVLALRGDIVESRHLFSVALCDATGRLVARSGDPELVTYWRSSAKFFQAIPLITEGAAERFRFTDAELALACASHNGEPRHVELVRGVLERTECSEEDLVCRPHPSLSEAVAHEMARRGEKLTRLHHNCSGKHAALLALARARGWPASGYNLPEHGVQRRCLAEVAAWTGVREDLIPLATDGCAVPNFALPLRAMALAYARLAHAASSDAAAAPSAAAADAAGRLVRAVASDPFFIAGSGRLDTDLIAASRGRVISKVGAEGVYCAALLDQGLGLAIKVEDGAFRAAGPALLAALDHLLDTPIALPDSYRSPPIRNSAGTVVGKLVARLKWD